MPKAFEILRWQLLQNDTTTKGLFKFANKQIIAISKTNTKDGKVKTSLAKAMLLPVTGLLYLVLMSKHHRYFMEVDVSFDEGWSKIEGMIGSVIEAVC